MEELYYQCSENKGADQLRGNHKADLHLCLHIYADLQIVVFLFVNMQLKYLF